MIIVRIVNGLGNQMYMYAAGRRLAHKLNTEFKLDITAFNNRKMHPYGLDQFNITATVATPDEIKKIQSLSNQLGIENSQQHFMPEVLDYPDNVYLRGNWIDHRYFADIADIIRQEFTLKNPLSPAVQHFKEKILATECSVSIHVRHGDFFYNPIGYNKDWRITTLDYYQDCLNTLRHQGYNQNMTAFVFSNNIDWCKENLHLDVPTEFVSGEEIKDYEEIYLMSLCKHNICQRGSTFSKWGSWLNLNPDKKIFSNQPSNAELVLQYRQSLTPSKGWDRATGLYLLNVPVDCKNRPEITMRPIFSLLLVVNNDAEIISDTLDSLLGQDYRYYEVIIIDNASTDGSNKICRQAIMGKKNVTYKRLRKKVSNATAWNIAFKTAQGYYVSFLKSGDQFLANALTTLYLVNELQQVDIIHMFASLAENEQGTIAFADKKYSAKRDAHFKDEKRAVVMGTDGQAAVKLLFNGQINNCLGTKIFYREFLMEQGIKFDEKLTDDKAELFFQTEAFLKSKYFMYVSNAFYVTPKP